MLIFYFIMLWIFAYLYPFFKSSVTHQTKRTVTWKLELFFCQSVKRKSLFRIDFKRKLNKWRMHIPNFVWWFVKKLSRQIKNLVNNSLTIFLIFLSLRQCTLRSLGISDPYLRGARDR